MKAKAAILTAMLFSGASIGAQTVFTPTLDLQISVRSAVGMNFVLINQPMAGVVFHRQEYPPGNRCPSTITGDFELRKVNAEAGSHAIQEFFSPDCGDLDSVKIDSSVVFEFHTARGDVYHMNVLQIMEDDKVKVRIIDVTPVGVARKPTAKAPVAGQGIFLIDGRKNLSAAGAANSRVGEPSRPVKP